MCLGAAWWARVKEIVYANNRADAATIGFDDDAIYEEVSAPLKRKLPIRRFGADEALEGVQAVARQAGQGAVLERSLRR